MTQSPELRELLDRQALTELLSRYSRAIDRCDRELLLSCYHPDAVEDHGPFSAGSPEDFADDVLGRHRGGPITQHQVTNMRFEIDGDVAIGESYAMSRSMDADGQPAFSWGRYIDRYERRGGEWKIISRRVLVEGASPALGIAVDASASRHDREDPSYRTL